MAIQCGGFVFTADFDSGNLAKVESVPKEIDSGPDTGGGSEGVDYEFNVWPQADCAGTEFENGNRTWFHFGLKGGSAMKMIKLNIVNLNRQVKMFSQGMTPVFRNQSTRNQWERIREKPTFGYDGSVFTLSFKHRLSDTKSFTYFAFTYPYSYTDLQTHLFNIDSKFNDSNQQGNADDIYYQRECVCYSLEGRRVDLLTISSHHDITTECEPRLPHLFPEESTCRPKKFVDKKVIFLSARVHPGETPSSFVMTGVINFLLTREDPIAQLLRKMYVFKIIPMLNPDGVARGHYRTDTRGVNLNRYYTNPSHVYHPSVFAARSLIIYHHYGTEEALESLLLPEIETKVSDLTLDKTNSSDMSHSSDKFDMSDVSHGSDIFETSDKCNISDISRSSDKCNVSDISHSSDAINTSNSQDGLSPTSTTQLPKQPEKSGLFLYIDFHGHASKKGIFMYGNHFQNPSDKVECMLLAKIMSVNSPHFHFHACNFTERIMYLRDRRDGLSREGAGRVAVGKITGLVRSYTLECNYNTGRIVNVVPPSNRDPSKRNSLSLVPPKYTPALFEEVGKALGVSILDMSNANPYSRIVNSEFHSLNGLRDWLRKVVTHESAAKLYKLKAKAVKERRKSSENLQMKRKTKVEMTSSDSATTSKSTKENLINIPKCSTKPVGSKKKLKKSTTSNVLQVRAKAANNLACCSKSLAPLPTKNKPTLVKKFSAKNTTDSDNIAVKKGPKRIKISTETESKWSKASTSSEVDSKWSKPTTSKADDAIKSSVPSWKSLSRLEKKSLDPTRRKKLKIKPK